jgi:MFS family permease
MSQDRLSQCYNFGAVNIKEWFTTPRVATTLTRGNLVNTQLDAIGVGIASVGGVFLPVFLSRLNASSLIIGLVAALPSVTGLLMALPAAQILERQKNIIPWYSITRVIFLAGYTLTGAVTFFAPKSLWIPIIVAIWALISIPQTILSITFSVVMNHVAGDDGRFELMSRRWSILSLVTAVSVFLAGFLLEKLTFPVNYQIMFIVFSLGGVLAYFGSNSLVIPPSVINPRKKAIRQQPKLLTRIWNEKPFVNVVIKRFVFLFGAAMIAPLFPLYYVREANLSDASIALISTVQTGILVFGYFFWMARSRKTGTRTSLLITTLGLAFYPLLISFTHNAISLVVIAGIAGIFQAGIDLTFFDELMNTIPAVSSSTFVAFYQEVQYASAIIAPLLGTFLAGKIGYSTSLMIGSGFLFAGFVLFATSRKAVVQQEIHHS